jgi:hypothetical protein
MLLFISGCFTSTIAASIIVIFIVVVVVVTAVIVVLAVIVVVEALHPQIKGKEVRHEEARKGVGFDCERRHCT